MEQKKRVEWRVGLYRCNVGERKGEWYPRVQLWGTVDLEQVIDKVVKERSDLRRETLQATASMLADKVMDFLVKGYAVSTPLGTFTPGVTGMWNPNRLLPEARAQNKACFCSDWFAETEAIGSQLCLLPVLWKWCMHTR